MLIRNIISNFYKVRLGNKRIDFVVLYSVESMNSLQSVGVYDGQVAFSTILIKTLITVNSVSYTILKLHGW